MRFALLAMLLGVSASCASSGPKCIPCAQINCSPTELEEWNDEVRLVILELKGDEDAEEH